MAKILRSVRLSPEADEALRVVAARTDRSVSQLVEMAVRSNYLAPAGARSTDGRESAATKVARERGSHWPGDVPAEDVPAFEDVEPVQKNSVPSIPGVRPAREFIRDSDAMARQAKLNKGRGL